LAGNMNSYNYFLRKGNMNSYKNDIWLTTGIDLKANRSPTVKVRWLVDPII